MNFYLNITNINKCLFSGRVKKIYISGSEGMLNIYPGHCPLLTMIKPGLLSIFITSNNKKDLYVSDGVLEIQPNNVNILSDESDFLYNLNYNDLINQKKDIYEKMLHNKSNNLKNQLFYILIKLKLLKHIKK